MFTFIFRVKLHFIVSCILFILISNLVLTVYASSYWGITPYSYAYNYHEGYWSDTYEGVVSVRGADRLIAGSNGYSVKWVSMRYDMQGQITDLRVDSNGINDTIQHKQRKTVKDKWNMGSTTKCSYDYELVKVFSNPGAGDPVPESVNISGLDN